VTGLRDKIKQEWDASRSRGDGMFCYATHALPTGYLVVAFQAGMRQSFLAGQESRPRNGWRLMIGGEAGPRRYVSLREA